MRLTFVFLLAIVSLTVRSQSFFDPFKIHRVEILFAEPDWRAILNANEAGTDDFLASTWTKIDGQIFEGAGVKWRGDYSYQPSHSKNPLHIELDFSIDSLNLEEQNDLYFVSEYNDPSRIRPALGFGLLADYMPSARSTWAQVFVNGQKIGLYSVVEEIGKTFAKTNFGSRSGAFFKCTPESPSAAKQADLQYWGPDSSAYDKFYEKTSLDGWAELIELCQKLNQQPVDSVVQILNVDRALWMLAAESVFAHLDGYSGAIARNFHLYQDEWGRFQPVLSDLSRGFAAYRQLDFSSAPISISAAQQLAPALNEANPLRPLASKLLADARLRKMFIAHFRTIFNEKIRYGDWEDRASALRTAIDTAAASDEAEFYSYQDFQNALAQNIGSGFAVPGLKPLLDGRAAFLENHAELVKNPPLFLAQPTVSGAVLGETATVSIQILGASTVLLGWRKDKFEPFERAPMFDDGLHGDGAANDGVWAAQLAVSDKSLHYHIWCENAEAGAFLPARAENEYFKIEAALPSLAVGAVVLNEILAENATGIADPAGQREDWIELHNLTASPQNLSGAFLSDDPTAPEKWKFPAGTTIAAGGYLLVWCDEDPAQQGLHASFKLSKAGETVRFGRGDGQLLDETAFGPQEADKSWARLPNGTGPFQKAVPTPGSSNSPAAAAEPPRKALKIWPAPIQREAFFELSEHQSLLKLDFFDALGQRVLSISANAGLPVDLTQLPAGFYFVIETDSKLIARILKI